MSSPHTNNLLNNNSSGVDLPQRRKRTKKATTSQEATADYSSKGNKEARRSCDQSTDPKLSPDGASAELSLENSTYQPQVLDNLPAARLSPDLVARLRRMMHREADYRPKTEFLLRINSACDDKVDARQRDEAIFNLLFLHKLYNLSPLCFAHAVNIADRFIVKVKVKPKYMACLATAAYLIAAKMVEQSEDCPSPEKLVSMARCGGSANDLERMESIIRSKLQSEAPAASAVTPLHYLLELRPYFASAKCFQRAVGDLEICLCSVAMYRFRASQLALGVARRYWAAAVGKDSDGLVQQLAELFELTDADLLACAAGVDDESRRAQSRSPTPRALVWQLSRRTMCSLQRPSSAAAHALQPITEDWLEEENLEICQLFH